MDSFIPSFELDQLNEKQLRSEYSAVLTELNNQPWTLQDWKPALVRLKAIQAAIAKRRQAQL